MRSRFIALVSAAGLVLAAASAQSPMQEWPVYAADAAATHYSPLADIDRSNVSQLAVAWEWKTGDDQITAPAGARPGSFENTPLMIDDVLYVSTSYNRVVALDAGTGRELWTFDPKAYEDGQPPNGTGFVHRGVAAWRDGTAAPDLHEQPREAVLPRREDRRAGQRVRRARGHRSDERPALAGRSEALHEHVAAGRLQESRDPRQWRRRPDDVPAGSARRRARVRREDRAAGVELPHGARPGRAGRRHVGRGVVEDSRATRTCGRR